MGISCDLKNGLATISLEETIDVSEAPLLKDSLVEALSSSRYVQVNVSRVAALDITAVQLLWSAKLQADLCGAGFVVIGPWAPDLASEFGLAGVPLLQTCEAAPSANGGIE